ncbi:MAG: hypothetical protein WAT09_04765 [Paracoccaceae bacterium]
MRALVAGAVFAAGLGSGLGARADETDSLQSFDWPPADYFTGVYERVGRDAATPPGLVNDLVRLDPKGDRLSMTVCGGGADQPPYLLAFDTIGDVSNLLTGGPDQDRLWCLYGNDGDNYPLLTCAGETGSKFMLWPQPDAPCAP